MTRSDAAAAAVSRLDALAFDVADASATAAFWAGLLERPVIEESGSAFLPGDQAQIGLRFVASEVEQGGRPRLHLHLTSTSTEDQQRRVEAALRLGGRHLDVGQDGDEGFVVLADPGGNELCVIEPGNSFLTGTGRLGEVTCDGTRTVGLFWRAALGWPLVWDEDEQTAIQSPLGGTKISWDTWGGRSAERATRRTRQRFDLLSVDPGSELGRLVAIGATLRTSTSDHLVLADPDGNEFGLRAG